jgi:hypothetical protein
VRVSLADLDPYLTLPGDEDGGVGLGCHDCWDGGRPLAYLAGCTTAYEDDDLVVKVSRVSALIHVGVEHVRTRHDLR